MQATQSKQNYYANQMRSLIEFEVEDHVFLWITPTIGLGKAIESKKLYLKFLEPYQIIRKIGLVAYEIMLSSKLANLHNVFHVSQLRKYIPSLVHVLEADDIHI